jgi:hypothetical protein
MLSDSGRATRSATSGTTEVDAEEKEEIFDIEPREAKDCAMGPSMSVRAREVVPVSARGWFGNLRSGR